ncbi:MAG: ATP-binding protein [Bacteroidota bacterium]
MLTIKTRVILSYTVVFGLMLSGFAFVIYKSLRDAAVSMLDSRLESYAHRVEAEIEEEHNDHRFPNLPDLLEIQTEGLYGVHFRLLDGAGAPVLSDTLLGKAAPPSVEPLQGRKTEIQDARIGRKRYRQVLMPVEIHDRNTYLLQAAAPMSAVEESLEHLRLLFLISIPAALLIASFAAYVITRAAFKPINTMVEAARKISADNLDSRVPLPSANDEIRHLGETFNSMIERIHAAFENQRQFIADASHELRTPLTVICSELEFIREHTEDDGVKESIKTSLTEIDRLARMTERMLTLSRLDGSGQKLNLQTIRLDEVIVDCVQLVRTLAAEKGIDLKLHIEEAVEMEADRDMIKSAILNLLDNALRYTESGGTVSVSLAMVNSDPTAVRVKVEDTGVGIAQSDLPHVFQRFYRSAASRVENSGSGLGLAIVEEVAKAHGGTVSLQSEPYKGTTVLLDFPLTLPHPKKA